MWSSRRNILPAKSWSQQMEWRCQDRNLGTTQTKYSQGGLEWGGRFWPQRCCFAFEWAARFRVLSLDSLTPGISVHPYKPRHVWFITVSNTFQENMPATNLMNEGYTPFGCPCSQRMGKENAKRAEAEKEELEENRRAAHFLSPPPQIRHMIRYKWRGNKEQRWVIEVLDLSFAVRVYLQNLRYLFWPRFSEKNKNQKE